MFCKYFRVAFLILNKYFRIAFRTVYSAAFLCPITISYPASVGSVDSSDLLRMRWMLNVYLESYDVGFQKLKLFLLMKRKTDPNPTTWPRRPHR